MQLYLNSDDNAKNTPEIDLSTEFIITIWRDNIGTNDATNSDANVLINNPDSITNIGTNIGTSGDNIATGPLSENKRL